MTTRSALFALGSALSLLAACDSGTSSPAPVATTPTDSLLNLLFAPPTTAETTLVAAQWAVRPPQVAGFQLDVEGRTNAALPFQSQLMGFPASWTTPDTVNTKLISHVVDGFRHHGALSTPAGSGKIPLLVFSHGGDSGLDSLEWEALLQSVKPFRDSIAVLAPSFRSEPVELLNKPVSEGTPSPWDRDIDDLRGLVRAAAKLEPRIDTTRVCLVGYSRGAGVALLAAERDPIFKSVATIAAPTAFQGPWVRSIAVSLLKGESVDLPGLDYLASTVLLPLQAGRISMDSARHELIRRSAVTWVRRLPESLQFHHGYSDVTVPFDELVRLQSAMQSIGRLDAGVDATFYPGKTHSTVVAPALQSITPFIRRNLLH